MSQQEYASLVAKVWNYAHVLRDQGISYGDYVEQITYLLFLKMDEERSELLGEPSAVPPQWRWDQLAGKDGDALELQYRHTLENLATQDGLMGTIFRKAQNKLTDPAKLKRVVSLIHTEGPWIGIGVDVKGQIYEGLLEKNACEVKSGAGQYFTPRPVIDALVSCSQPQVGETVCDPACGTGGFLLSAYDYMKGQSQDRERLRRLRHESFTGVDLVDEVVRLCAMNLYLHGIGNGGSPVRQGDSLAADPGQRYDVVLTNPPFGKKSSYRVVGEDGDVTTARENYERDDRLQVHYLQQAIQLPPAHHDHPGAERSCRGCATRQCALRGGTVGRRHPQAAAGAIRLSHAAAPTHRYLVQCRGQGECALLRQKARGTGTVD